jgi:hypothetical protein
MLRATQLNGFDAGLEPYYISASGVAISGTAETLSWSHTTTPETTCLVVGQTIIKNGATAGTSTVTFNGVSFSQIVSVATFSGFQATRLHVLFNPPVGTFTLSVTISGTIDRGHCAQAINLGNTYNYSGTATAANENISTGVDLTSTLRAGGAPCLIIGQVFGRHRTTGTIPTLVVNSPSMTQADTRTGTVNTLGTRISMYYADQLAPGGDNTMNVECSNATLTPLQYAFAAFLS